MMQPSQQLFPPKIALLASLLSISSLAWAADAQDDSLPEVKVLAEKISSTYNTSNSKGAMRTDTPLLEVPQAVRVVNAQFLDDLGAVRLADTVDFVSGITRLNDFGGTWDNFGIRGFSSTDMGFLLNGFPGSRGFNPRKDTATVESIEFLKGPASAVYGSSEPGGTINIITKKPRFRDKNTAEFGIGSSGLRRGAFDSTGPLGADVAYRLNVMAEEGDTRSSLLANRRALLAPALTWKINRDTVLNYEGELLQSKTPLDRGLINVRGVLGTLPRERILNETADGNMNLRSNTQQLALDHTFANNWHARIGVSYKETGFDGYYTEADSLAADNRTLNRRRTWRQLPSRDVSLQAQLDGKATIGSLDHALLIGAEASRLWMNTEIVRSANLPIDIYAPVYGQGVADLVNRTSSSDERQQVKAIFAQDQIALSPQWKLLLGLRWDQYRQRVENRVPKITTTVQQQNALSPRAGLSYLPNAWSSYYVSAGKSFRGNSGADINGRPFDPQHSTAYEAGLKLQTLDERLGASFAVYDITKTNVLTSSEVPGFSVAAGEVKSSGAEADVYGQLTADWRLSGNVSWDNARITRDNSLRAGTRLANIPAYSAGVLAMRKGILPNGDQYGLGGGVNYVANRSGNTADTYALPAYAIVKLLSYWQISKTVRVSLDVHNLFDRRHYTGSWGNLYVIPGTERSVVARLKFDL